MWLRNLVWKIYGIDKIITNKNKEIIRLLDDQAVLKRRYTTTLRELQQCRDGLTLCRSSYMKLEELLKDRKPTNVPSANITYIRPVLVGSNKWTMANIDVRLFVQPDFIIEREIKQKKLQYTTDSSFDTLVPKIYHWAKRNYAYGSDKYYGFSEYWMFPFEVRCVRDRKLASDCDDWANWIASYFAAAGLPRNRWLVSCGYTRSGFGHATLYVKDDSGTWRHLNSTRPHHRYRQLSKFPANDDPRDNIGIHNDKFWFSYNDRFSINKFEVPEAESTFNKELGNKINIKRKRERRR